MKSFADIRNSVRRVLQDTEGNYWSDDEIDDYLNEGQEEFVRRTHSLIGEAPITIKENHDSYTLPEDILEIIRIEDVDGNELTPTTSKALQDRFGNFRDRSDTTGGKPSWYYSDLDGDKAIRFYPRPNPAIEETARATMSQALLFESGLSLPIAGSLVSMATRSITQRRTTLVWIVVITTTHIGIFSKYPGYSVVSTHGVYPLATATVGGVPTAITLDIDYSTCGWWSTGTQLGIWIQDSTQNIYKATFSEIFTGNPQTITLTSYVVAATYWLQFEYELSTTITAQANLRDPIIQTSTGLLQMRFNSGLAPVSMSTGWGASVQMSTKKTGMPVHGYADRIYVATEIGLVSKALSSTIYLGAAAETVIDAEDCYGVIAIGSKVYYNRGGTDIYVYDEVAATNTDTTYDTVFLGDYYPARSESTSTGPMLYDGTYLWILKDESTVHRFTLDSDNAIVSVDDFYLPILSAYRPAFAFELDGQVFFKDAQPVTTSTTAVVLVSHDPDLGTIIGSTSFTFVDNVDVGFTVDMVSTASDDIISFDSEYGIVVDISITSVGAYIWYVRKPKSNLVEVSDPIVLEYYALYRAYEKDADQSNFQKGMYYHNKFKDNVARDKQKSKSGYTKSKQPNKGVYF